MSPGKAAEPTRAKLLFFFWQRTRHQEPGTRNQGSSSNTNPLHLVSNTQNEKRSESSTQEPPETINKKCEWRHGKYFERGKIHPGTRKRTEPQPGRGMYVYNCVYNCVCKCKENHLLNITPKNKKLNVHKAHKTVEIFVNFVYNIFLYICKNLCYNIITGKPTTVYILRGYKYDIRILQM